MSRRSLVLALALAAVAAAGPALAAQPAKKTVCTITVNSADEKEMFQSRLPRDKYQFVELVERGRPDWLASACSKGIQCDALIISGHFAGTDFFSEEIETKEYLPVDEMERVSCSDSCPGLFSNLKEVYLFGCNTLNTESLEGSSAEIIRTLTRSGVPRGEAERQSRALAVKHGETNRDHMRRIFADVPVIYGFSSKAPVGAVAAGTLSRYFHSGGAAEVGSGRASGKLLGMFAGNSMTATSGVGDSGPQAAYREQVCQFHDERLELAQKLDFVHEILDRDMTEVRMYLDRIEKLVTALTDSDRSNPAVADELAQIAADKAARDRFLAFARDNDRPEVSARMVKVAGALGWLAPEAQRVEHVRIVAGILGRNNLGPSDVDFVCGLNADRRLDAAFARLQTTPAQLGNAAVGAVLACMGNATGHERVLRATASANLADVHIAQVYFKHRPLTDAAELRAMTLDVAAMPASEAKIRALETLAGQRISDRESLEALARSYAQSESVAVQRAIAGILLRADFKSIERPELIRTLSGRRLRSADGQDIIDVLLRRLRLS